MVIKEKIEKADGPHLRLNMPFASEPDFICFDKSTQTSSGDTLDGPLQVKAKPHTVHIFVPEKAKYYVQNTRSRLQEKGLTVQSGLELENFLLELKHKTGIADMEHHESISLTPITEECNEKPLKTDPTATVTGQILLAVASLRDSNRNNIQAAAIMLNSLLKKEKNKLRGKVPEIIDIIYFHLNAIQDRSAREAAIGAVCLLVEAHTDEAISSLLRLSFFCDRHVTQIWEALGQAKQPVRLQVLAKLLEVLKRRPSLHSEPLGSDLNFKDNNTSFFPLAATKALGIIFKDKRCKVPMNSFYVSVIIFLVIQLHYLVSSLDDDYGQEEILKTSHYISCTMETLKALIKRERSSQTCFTSLTENWELLSSPENYLEGVFLLARALVKNHHGLDYAVFTKVIPFLHHGDDQQKLTAMAFFTALLSSESTYTVLQKHYILSLLKSWQIDSNPTYRWLSLHGMGNVIQHLQNRKELTSLILSILPNFNDSDEKVTLTAIEVITKEVAHHKTVNHVLLKIVKQLQPFLVDRRNNVCCAANQLFQDILKTLDPKDKSSMQDQVLNSIVTLMLNLEDPHLDVTKSRTNSLQHCKAFLGWTANDNENFWNVLCKHLVKEHPGKLRGFLDQAQEYTQSPQKSSRIAAATFIDSIFQHMESSHLQKSEVDHLRRALRAFPSDRCSVPVVSEPEKVCRYCPDLFRCSRYFPRSCI
ncbi:maestro heat-like repeat-containing protein family member 6 [Notechis scutatus]|uniref:Maestro heat-like repeat-containing protein family member 6 n=1 Tax=Notechis scutatus TaxID=8663 RepID=A0A6J1UA42_9SAUR|nr:maestro heat-like repeat-containing protein family member 6 [Notechis scutatus]